MSLFGSMQIAGNALNAMQIGLQVVGNNISNANTPGYVRERANFSPAPTQKLGNLTLGLGVQVDSITQNIDKFIEARLRDSRSDRASADVQEKVYRDLESILGELSDTDVSTSLSNFFNSIDEVASSPESIPVRNLAVQAGQALATSLNTLDRRVATVHDNFTQGVTNLTGEVNELTKNIRDLNLQIVALEGGGTSSSEAGGLRSQRQQALTRLAEIADIDVTEQQTGAVNVVIGGDMLVFEGIREEVKTDYASKNGRIVAAMEFAKNDSPLKVTGGELHGIYQARDNIVGGFLDSIDDFAGSLAFEFNKLFSQGQGITGFRQVTSTESVDTPTATLDDAGLPFTPVNGSFNLLVHNSESSETKTHAVQVDLNGLDGDDTLASLAAKLNAIEGVSAEVTYDNQLRLKATSPDTELGFEGDTSGLLAALGVNTFFTGSGASTLGINSALLSDGSKFAAAIDGIGVGTGNAIELSALQSEALETLGGSSLTDLYDKAVNETTQGSTVASAVADGYRNFEATLEASSQAVSGVNLDEEAVDMIQLQRTYQASARFLSTISQLLDTLINL